MSNDFMYTNRVNNERIERDFNGNTLKKYNGTETSWPTHTKVQMFGESHASQQNNFKQIPNTITDFMKKL